MDSFRDIAREDLILLAEKMRVENTQLRERLQLLEHPGKDKSSISFSNDLQLSNLRLRMAREKASISQWRFCRNTGNIQLSGSLYLLLGMEEELSVCSLEHLLSFVHLDDVSKLVDHFYNDDSLDAEYLEFRLKLNGNTKYLHSKVIFSEMKESSGIVIEGIVQDVTYIIERYQELETVKYGINNSVEEIYACRSDGTIVFANIAFSTYHGINDTISNYKIYNLNFENSSQKEWLRLVKIIRDEGGYFKFQVTFSPNSDKKRNLEVVTCIIKDNSDNEILWFFSWDITEHKRTEEDLIFARLQAEKTDHLKTAFLANMSHEIRTPMNAIVGFSKLIIDSIDEEEKKQYASIIDRNAEVLLQLINDVLDISKIEAGTLDFIETEMDVVDICRNVYHVHRDRVYPGVALMFECKYDTCKYVSDSRRLSQVINNLITNACKFTYEGKIKFGFEVKEKTIDFFVKDSGIGIAKEKISTIFDRFIKLNGSAQGTGLGLAISKMIIEKMGGSIMVESEEGKGTIFRFVLPYNNELYNCNPEFNDVKNMNDENNMTTPKPDTGKKVILVAEDVDSNYLLLKAFIGKDYTLIHAKNGIEAVEKHELNQPDLILMDIKMPDMDGLEATKIIRGISSAIPIIALTAFAFDADKQKALEAGCNDFLTKPVSKVALVTMIEKFI